MLNLDNQHIKLFLKWLSILFLIVITPFGLLGLTVFLFGGYLM